MLASVTRPEHVHPGNYYSDTGEHQLLYDELWERFVPARGPPTAGGEAAQIMYMLSHIQREWGNNGYCNVSTSMSREWAKKRWPEAKPVSEVYYYQEKMLAYLRDRHHVRSAGRLLQLLAGGNPFGFADLFEQNSGEGSATHDEGNIGDEDNDEVEEEGDGEEEEEFAGFDAIDLATFKVGCETMHRIIGMLPPGFAHLVGKKASEMTEPTHASASAHEQGHEAPHQEEDATTQLIAQARKTMEAKKKRKHLDLFEEYRAK